VDCDFKKTMLEAGRDDTQDLETGGLNDLGK
jgi:hypothetical protein